MSNIKQTTSTVYVLQCEHNRIYVGATKWWNIRKHQHGTHLGAAYTRVHKPIKAVLLVQGIDYEDEDKVERFVTEYFMSKFGLDSTRGGKVNLVREGDTWWLSMAKTSGLVNAQTPRLITDALHNFDSHVENAASALPNLLEVVSRNQVQICLLP